jgi:hypothetical protein
MPPAKQHHSSHGHKRGGRHQPITQAEKVATIKLLLNDLQKEKKVSML